MLPTLCIVVPCYNEFEALPFTAKALTDVLANIILKQKINSNSFLCLVDDGSRDNTWQIIENLSHENKSINIHIIDRQ